MKNYRLLNKEDVIRATDYFFDPFIILDGDKSDPWVSAAEFLRGEYVGKTLDNGVIRREIISYEDGQ